MWGTIIRVGGTDGTKLRINTCNKDVKQELSKCMASTMMLHVTRSGTIYMEDVWLWVAG
jgi:glucan 1,3-beta-glucosidase